VDWELIEPYTVDLNYSVVPPDGFVPKELPKSGTQSLGPATLKEEFSTTDDGTVHVRLAFDTVKRRYTRDRGHRTAQQGGRPPRRPRHTSAFEPRARCCSRGQSERSPRHVIATSSCSTPRRLCTICQLADVLLDAGMGEAARAQAREAVKLDPKSPLAQKVLAQIPQARSRRPQSSSRQ